MNTTKPKIVVLDGHALNPGDLDWRAIEALGHLTVYDRSPSQVIERAADAPIVLTNKTVLSRDVLQSLPGLRYVGVLATGTNIVDLDAARQRGVIVTNAPGYATDAVAQHTFALILELTNRVAQHATAVREGRWASSPDFSFTLAPIPELAGKTLGIIGFGTIGRRVAQIGRAFGMTIATVARGTMGERTVGGVAIQSMTLDELFATSDILTLHCPLTDETRHLASAKRLACMKPTALLINTGRGPLVDETALATALEARQLAGAAVDVLSAEPPPESHPLVACPNCLVTPHLAWAAVEARERLMQITAENIAAYLSGSPRNVVNG